MNSLNWDNFTLAQWNRFTLTGWDFFVLDGEFYDPNDYFVEAVEAYVPAMLKSIFQPVQKQSIFRAGKIVSDLRQ